MFGDRFRIFCRYSFVVLLALIPDRALAHLVNTDVAVFYAGMMHPLTSSEHLLPAIALALLASQLGKQACRIVVFVFPASLAAGILIGSLYPQLSCVRTINLLLLVVLGGLLMVPGGEPRMVASILSVCTGMVLGYRSGVDMSASGVGLQFIPGVVLTGLIIVVLVASWVPQAASTRSRLIRGAMGGFVSLTGILLLLCPTSFPDLQAVHSVAVPGPEDVVSRINGAELSSSVFFAALAASLLWGAGHALTPGHGKTIVAAYLVGAHSTPWHAVYLGLTVAATHTVAVFALGLVTLLASRFLLPEQLYPWIGLTSGLILASMGASMAVSRFRSLLHAASLAHYHPDRSAYVHDHGEGVSAHDAQDGCDRGHENGGSRHSHPHAHIDHHGHTPDGLHDPVHDHGHDHSHCFLGADDTEVSSKALLGLGITGGLLPCPGALVLLLTAISLGHTGLGMILVTAFSLGLAGVLIAVGLIFVHGRRLLDRIPQASGFSRWLPVGSALVVFGVGTFITIRAAASIW